MKWVRALQEKLHCLSRGDRIALGLLCLVPVVLIVLPALAGYPLLTGDNVIQNYPLRVLAGQAIRRGHLPVFDPYGFSGTPLLGGINAGAAYPTIALFAVLPPLSAFVAAEVVAFVGAAVGLYTFLRLQALSPLASALAASWFGFGGYLSSQATHLDVVQVGAGLAWALVAIDRVVAGAPRLRRTWIAVLSGCVGSIGLAGSPEVSFYAAVVVAIYAIHIVIGHCNQWRRLSFSLFVSAACGLAIACVQIVPGARFLATSQRSDVGFSFLTRGSIAPSNLILFAVPHLFGGGPIGLRPYVGPYNLGEIDAYGGLIALIAIVSLAFSWRSPQAKRFRVWYLIGLIGLLIALGSHTPFLHLVAAFPIVQASRLPSRALLLYGTASAVLLGYFVDGTIAGAGVISSNVRRRAQRAVALLIPVGVLAFLLAVIIGGTPLATDLANRSLGPWSVARLSPYLACTALLAIGVLVFVAYQPKLSPRRKAQWLASLVLFDLVLFLANQSSFAPIRQSALGQPNALETTLKKIVGPTGRFVIDDPKRSGGEVLNEIGAPNLNAMFGINSAQGYGSLTWDPYADITGTHGQDVINTGAFRGTTLDDLNVRAVLIPKTQVSQQLRAVLSPPHYRRDGTIGPYAVFLNTRAVGASRLVNVTNRSLARGSVLQQSSSPYEPKASIRVSVSHAARLVESVADIPGWHATITHNGVAHSATIHQYGLVQSVLVPSGSSTVTFTYDAPGLLAGLLASAVGCLGAIGLVASDVVGSRRCRRRRIAIVQRGTL